VTACTSAAMFAQSLWFYINVWDYKWRPSPAARNFEYVHRFIKLLCQLRLGCRIFQLKHKMDRDGQKFKI